MNDYFNNKFPDIACALANGADFTFLGRPFVYGVAALGEKGAYHTINSLHRQLDQVMGQLRCAKIANLPRYLAKTSNYSTT